MAFHNLRFIGDGYYVYVHTKHMSTCKDAAMCVAAFLEAHSPRTGFPFLGHLSDAVAVAAGGLQRLLHLVAVVVLGRRHPRLVRGAAPAGGGGREVLCQTTRRTQRAAQPHSFRRTCLANPRYNNSKERAFTDIPPIMYAHATRSPVVSYTHTIYTAAQWR